MGTLAAAFSPRSLSRKLLFGADLSYGTYLYHSVVINVFMQLGWMTSIASVAQVFATSILLALMSWHWIENLRSPVKLSPLRFFGGESRLVLELIDRNRNRFAQISPPRKIPSIGKPRTLRRFDRMNPAGITVQHDAFVILLFN